MELDITRLLNAGASGLSFVKTIDWPLSLAKTVCNLGSAFSYTGKGSQKILKSVNLALAPADFAAFALDTFELGLYLNGTQIPVTRACQLAFSNLKKSCDMVAWLQQYRFIALESSIRLRLEGSAILSGFLKDSIRLWEDLGTHPPSDRDLIVSIPKVLKSSLLLYAYLADDKRVKTINTGLGLCGDVYSLYRRCGTINPHTWTVTKEQICQTITLISVASLVYYMLEKGFISE
jgi:hypothetical protein